MTTQTIASWISAEHTRIAELAAGMQEKVAVVPRANQAKWIADVTDAFEDFRTHVLRHQSLEEEGGYMVGVVEQRPALSAEVDRLAREHVELGRIMTDIHRQLVELEPADKLLLRDTCRRIQTLLQYLEHHTKDEDILVLSVFTDDGGAED